MIQVNLLNCSTYQYRLPIIKAALKEFSNIKEENRSKINLYAFCNEVNSTEWENLIKIVADAGIDTTLVSMPDDEYINKVNVIKESTAKYICKWDDDVFISRHVWDYLIENVNIVDDPTVSVLAPTLSNGMPSVGLFIKDFLNDEETEIVHKIFIKDNIDPKIFRCNYESIFEAIKNMTKWEDEKYWKLIDTINPTKDRIGLPWFYTIVKGVHPARFSYDYNMFVANHAINNQDILLGKSDFYIDRYITPYFCNNLFLCSTEFYIDSQKLFYDNWDEGQLTMLANQRNQSPAYVRNCYGIHMAYGCTNKQKEIQDHYLNNLFSKLA
jgi:hypothetical protein